MLATLALVGLALAGIGLANAQSPAEPPTKVFASGSTIEVIGPNVEATVLSATLRSSSPTDVILTVAMECSIFAQIRSGPSDAGDTDSALTAGHVRAWVEIDGQIVAVDANGAPGTQADKVTFCNRASQRLFQDVGRTLTNPEGDGQSFQEDFAATKAAHSFSWLRLDLSPGDHTIVVKATLLQDGQGDATARAAIGNRVLVAEPAALANHVEI